MKVDFQKIGETSTTIVYDKQKRLKASSHTAIVSAIAKTIATSWSQ